MFKENVIKENLIFGCGIFLFLLMSISSVAQNDLFTDSLTNNVIENVYKEEPETSKKDTLKRTSLNAYPYAYYTPETQLAFGAGGIFIFYGGKSENLRPSKIGFGGYYSTNKQYKLSISPNFYFFDNKLYMEFPTSFGYFINKYWGIGSDVPEYENASYSIQNITSTFKVQVPPRLFLANRTGLILDYDYTKIVDQMDNDLIKNDSLIGYDGGNLIGIGTDLVWDTRDNIFFPNSGAYQYFKALYYPGISDYTFSIIELDVRGFKAFSPDHVLAMQFYIKSATGETPFYKLPALGGASNLRGYFNGRYRDNFMGMMQLEYRQYIWGRLGIVAFAGAGNVSESMIEYKVDNLKYSFGGGLRLLFNKEQKVNLRMDIGFGNDGNRGIYFGIQEAF